MEEIVKMLSKKTRKRETLWQRYYFVAFLRDRGWTFERIAEKLGLHHSTMIHSYRMHSDWSEDEEYVSVTKPIAQILEEANDIDVVMNISEGSYFMCRKSGSHDYKLDRFVGYESGWYIGRNGRYIDVKRIVVL